MNNRPELNDLLDQWAKREISFEELATLSEATGAESLREEAALHREAISLVQRYGIRNTIAEAHNRYMQQREVPAKQAKVIGITPRKLLVSATAAAAILTGIYLSQGMLAVNPERVYNNSFQDYYVNTERSTGQVSSGEAITELFRGENYTGVAQQFGKLTEVSNKERFLAGYAHLKTGNYAAAASLFSQMIETNQKNGSAYFQDEAEYYLAMAYLKTGMSAKAYPLLQAIHDNKEHTYNGVVDKWTLLRMKWFK